MPHALLERRKLRHTFIRTSPRFGPPPGRRADPSNDSSGTAEQGLAALGRDAGLRTPDSVATPEMAEQTGLSVSVLRWVPVYVAGLVAIVVAGVGLVVLTVL